MAEIKTQTLDSYLRLIEISRDLASTLDLDTLLNDIVRASADITHAEAASILLYDDTSRQLYFQVSTNIDEPTMPRVCRPHRKEHCRLGGDQPQVCAHRRCPQGSASLQ